jgi:threonyl-tRNA synthetase
VSAAKCTRDEAVGFFKGLGEHYKAEIIASIPAGSRSPVRAGRLGHRSVPRPARAVHRQAQGLQADEGAGAYWRGDSRNEMLQRIYGTAWANEKDLKAYLHAARGSREARPPQDRPQLDLFHMQEEAPGMVFWHPKGWTLFQHGDRYMRGRAASRGYQEVNTPQMMDARLWERPGHWDKFGENMFTTDVREREYAIKPMNCPGHVQIFNQGLRSYRDLPLRWRSSARCHRNEPSGALHGLMRVRASPRTTRTSSVTRTRSPRRGLGDRLILDIYGLRLRAIEASSSRTARRSASGDDAVWDKAEAALKQPLPLPRARIHAEPGRGRVLRPEARVRAQGRHRPRLAVRHLQVDF